MSTWGTSSEGSCGSPLNSPVAENRELLPDFWSQPLQQSWQVQTLRLLDYSPPVHHRFPAELQSSYSVREPLIGSPISSSFKQLKTEAWGTALITFTWGEDWGRNQITWAEGAKLHLPQQSPIEPNFCSE